MRPIAIAIAVTAAALPATSRASQCPAPEGSSGALASVEAERRLTYITGALDRASDRAVKWGGAWRATFQVAATVQFALAFTAKREADRIDFLGNGIKASTAFLFAAIFRLPAERHVEPWADRPWEQGSICERLAAAEKALALDAKMERRGRSIGMQALGLGFNVAVGVTTYLLHRRLWSTALAAVSGALVGELRVFTQPTVAADAEDAYLQGRLDARAVSVVPLFVPRPGGGEVGVSVTF